MRDLIKELGLGGLTQEERDQIIVQLTDSLLKRMILRVYDKLGEADQKEFDRITAEGDAAKINSFLEKKIPDLNEIRDGELDELIVEMKDFLAAAGKEK